jgi:hypothetical protein
MKRQITAAVMLKSAALELLILHQKFAGSSERLESARFYFQTRPKHSKREVTNSGI